VNGKGLIRDGFQLVKTPDGRVLRIADLVTTRVKRDVVSPH